MTSTNNPQAIREAVLNGDIIAMSKEGERILSAVAPLLAPTPPVSTSAEKCAREIANHACNESEKTVELADGSTGYDQMVKVVAAIIQRHFNGQGEDSALLDWIEDGHNTVTWNDRAGGFIVQKCQQVVGNIGTGRTIRDAIKSARSAMSAQTQG